MHQEEQATRRQSSDEHRARRGHAPGRGCSSTRVEHPKAAEPPERQADRQSSSGEELDHRRRGAFL